MTQPKLLFDLFLVRHAQSCGNAGIHTGDTAADRQDPILSETGERQALRLGERFSDVPLDAILASGLRRALQTASAVAGQQPPDGTKTVEVLPLLTECNVLEGYAGFSFDELRSLAPASRPADGWDSPQTVLPNNEQTDEAYNIDRAKQVMRVLRSRFHSGERVMAVGHGMFNTVLLMQALEIDPQRFDPDFDNTGVTYLSFYEAGTGPWGFDVRLRTLNDTAHLNSDVHTGGQTT